MNKYIVYLMTVVLCMAMGGKVYGQDNGYDVFNPISKYLAKGDADKLSAWFS